MTPTLQRYHQPSGGRLGDAIPFYWEDTWHVFYLDYKREWWSRTPPGARHTTWAHAYCADLEHWQLAPVAIAPGPEGAVDSGSCATGSVFEHAGRFYLFYTGRYFTTDGRRRETICLATSDDLMHWDKLAGSPIARPDPERFSPEHWRDPFVLWNADAGEFWMVVTAELAQGPAGRKGCLALMRSADLTSWEHAGTLWAPNGTTIPECPAVFRWGDWWYLIYSVNAKTVYRRARSLSGPWRSAPMEAFDDRFFYAAKSAGDGSRRVLFGWLATKGGGRDDGPREWGGQLVARELLQQPDGSLAVAFPPEHVLASPAARRAVLQPCLGRWHTTSDGVANEQTDGFAYATVSTPPDAQIRVCFRPAVGTRAFGLYLRTQPDLSTGYALRIDQTERRVSLGPVGPGGRLIAEFSQPFADLDSGADTAATDATDLACTVTMDGAVVDVAVGVRVTLIGRFHDHRGETLAVWAEEGSVAFHDVEIVPLSE